jgi:SNF2 family DNA or RNA helicase
VRRRLPRHFDLLIVDEGHEEKGRATAQGLAAGTLAAACARSLVLTGTLLGGYASTLFFLLWRFLPAVRAEFAYGDVAAWIARYGYIERITRRDPNEHIQDGRRSRRRLYPTRVVEKPGVTPPIILQLIGNTIFIRLADVAADLPAYTERVQLVPLDGGTRAAESTQASAYHQLARELRAAVRQALQQGSKRLLGAYLQALLSYPDACTRKEVVLDPDSGMPIGVAPALPPDRLYPKEQALVELVRRERQRRRRVLCYITHTGTHATSRPASNACCMKPVSASRC